MLSETKECDFNIGTITIQKKFAKLHEMGEH